MNKLDKLKNSLIDCVLATQNQKLLEGIKSIFDSTQEQDFSNLSSEQIEMLLMSENDISSGKLISETELNKRDAEWLQ
jgi:hypothetical protein